MSWDYPETSGQKADEWESKGADTNDFGWDTKESGNNDYGGYGDTYNGSGDNYQQAGDNDYDGDGGQKDNSEVQCYGCGQFGHYKGDCPNPDAVREFTGTCRICEKEGHRASECPDKPAVVCRNCQQEGHEAFGCERPRKINRDHVKDMTAEEAWTLIKTATDDRDLDDLKEAIEIYIKAEPDTTYQQLEQKFRDDDIGVYIIALEKELAPTYTNMDMQGNLEKTYSITWRWSPKPMRPKEKQFWPSTPEENFERLQDAGEPADRGVPICNNCNTLGHTRKRCPEEIVDNTERASVMCFNCNTAGHRMRDCPEPRTDRFACKNCHQSGHSAAECPEPRSAEGIECNKCNQMGHFSRDCPESGGQGDRPAQVCHNCGQEGHRKSDCTNEAVLICRNCDATGHISRECPLPRDYSRIKCQNCDQMGHTKVRCKEPPKDTEENYGGNQGQETDQWGGGNETSQWEENKNDQWKENNNDQWGGNDNVTNNNADSSGWDQGPAQYATSGDVW